MADETMEIDGAPLAGAPKHASPPGQFSETLTPQCAFLTSTCLCCSAPSAKDNFREIQVKVHVRQADKDSWLYLGRGVVTQDVYGQSSPVGQLPTLPFHL